jgi:hypothetical protein
MGQAALTCEWRGRNELVIHRTITETVVLYHHFQNRGRVNLALDQGFRKRVFNVLLESPA